MSLPNPHTKLLLDSLEFTIQPPAPPVRHVLDVDELIALHDRDLMQQFQLEAHRRTPCSTANFRMFMTILLMHSPFDALQAYLANHFTR
jgi:hypothetical protein